MRCNLYKYFELSMCYYADFEGEVCVRRIENNNLLMFHQNKHYKSMCYNSVLRLDLAFDNVKFKNGVKN